MIAAVSTPRNRTLSSVFLVLSCVLAAVAILVGIDDNPPGIFLAFGAAAALILAFIHPWRTTKQFVRFLIAAIVAFVLLAVLHNVFYGLADMAENQKALQIVLQVLSVATFLIAVLICPPAIAIGVVGSIALIILRHRQSPLSEDG